MPRYALYFSPEPDDPWSLAGDHWLGRDVAKKQVLPQPVIAGLTQAQLHGLTINARRYGFHATLKAPFHLTDACDIAQLDSALARFCTAQAGFTIPLPRVQWMGNFLALLPYAACPEINTLALHCMRHFARFSAPLSASELARRNTPALSPRQQELLLQWGYPYTEEEFRFHMTLSDAQNDLGSALSTLLHDAATRHFSIAEPLRVSSIALFRETAPGDDFELLNHYRFGS